MRLRTEMKHGDKAKAKSAKASSKTSGKKASSKAGGEKGVKAAKSEKAGKVSSKKAAPVKAENSKTVKAAPPKGAVKASIATNQSGVRVGNGGPNFSSLAIANAFKRAIKKYPNAFRRLTD